MTTPQPSHKRRDRLNEATAAAPEPLPVAPELARTANPTRRDARECAVQLLFQLDLNAAEKLEPVFAHFWKTRDREMAPLDEKTRAFAERMVRGVRENQAAVDEAIRTCAANWDIRRMAAVDRNILRMGVYEMLFCHDVPPVVSINEAVDLAKYFSSSESGRFVNGILDRIRKDLSRPSRTATHPQRKTLPRVP